MSDDHDKFHFNAEKIFLYLFVLTAAEVAWGYLAKDFGHVLLWGGLILCAIWKGLLIATYFMHLKFEGWIVKGLIVPTPVLALVIFGYVLPDVANHDGPLVHPVGAQLVPETGEVQRDMEPHTGHADDGGADHDHEEGGH